MLRFISYCESCVFRLKTNMKSGKVISVVSFINMKVNDSMGFQFYDEHSAQFFDFQFFDYG